MGLHRNVIFLACCPVFVSPWPALHRARRRVADGRVESKRCPDEVVDPICAPRGERADAAKEHLAHEAVVLQYPISNPLKDVILEQKLEIHHVRLFVDSEMLEIRVIVKE